MVLDNRFISRRVNELNNWKIKFIQADILDYNSIRKIIYNADVVHHLAGITNVAYLKKDSDKVHDELIKKTSITGTQNILDSMNSDSKIIFPSSHVIFEGIKKKRKYKRRRTNKHFLNLFIRKS